MLKGVIPNLSVAKLGTNNSSEALDKKAVLCEAKLKLCGGGLQKGDLVTSHSSSGSFCNGPVLLGGSLGASWSCSKDRSDVGKALHAKNEGFQNVAVLSTSMPMPLSGSPSMPLLCRGGVPKAALNICAAGLRGPGGASGSNCMVSAGFKRPPGPAPKAASKKAAAPPPPPKGAKKAPPVKKAGPHAPKHKAPGGNMSAAFWGRRLHWEVLPGSVQKTPSIFHSCDSSEEHGEGVEQCFDQDEWVRLFAPHMENGPEVASSGSSPKKEPSARRKSLGVARPDEIKVLSQQKATCCGVVLARLGLDFVEVGRCLAELRPGKGMSEEELEKLQELLNNVGDEEHRMLQDFKKSSTEAEIARLRDVEARLLPLLEVPRARQRLRVLRFSMSLPASSKRIREALYLYESATAEVMKSTALRELIRRALDLGNFVNCGPKMKEGQGAVAVQLGSLLTSMREFKALDPARRSVSLLQFLASTILRQCAGQAEQLDAALKRELPHLQSVLQVPFSTVKEQTQALLTEAMFVDKERTSITCCWKSSTGKTPRSADLSIAGDATLNTSPDGDTPEESDTKHYLVNRFGFLAEDGLVQVQGLLQRTQQTEFRLQEIVQYFGMSAPNGTCAARAVTVLRDLHDLVESFCSACQEVRKSDLSKDAEKRASDLAREASDVVAWRSRSSNRRAQNTRVSRRWSESSMGSTEEDPVRSESHDLQSMQAERAASSESSTQSTKEEPAQGESQDGKPEREEISDGTIEGNLLQTGLLR